MVKEEVRALICCTCREILANHTGLIEGCRKMAFIRSEFDLGDDPDFMTFVTIASETDDYPEQDIRKNFNPEYLGKLLQRNLDYVNKNRELIYDDCRALISRYGPQL